ncbi:hypothetical protein M409DRAFT_36572 [Zasmidium cellare ATCC 36951]|uniref:FAD/NAD(P)-binding domain-containing protein n=1 Tax=Zasmidium cellare ATCC 36951 TaxID=1080233 RepID=A0A6A6CMU2_ZASCE|nr:uncharacterized protein M409DRAFT_36572 [Zasmidium cellare ATCC 36951]KAF2167538.1 hypothetical protein M409DRAFT_36572 [Zasmidium cellare ATCC 36951]
MATKAHKNIVILGASYAGVSTAHYLLKHVLPNLPDEDRYCVVLVSMSEQVLCRPACLRAMISDAAFDQKKLFVDVRECFEMYTAGSWEFLQGKALRVDFEERCVHVVGEEGEVDVGFHALVIATGACTPSPLLGLNGSGEELRRAWKEFRLALPKAKTMVIAGGGPAGVETAAELAEHLDTTRSTKPQITLITSGERLLPVLRPSIAAQAEKDLTILGVKVLKKTKVLSTTPEDAGAASARAAATKLHLSTGQTLDADLYIPTTGTRPNTSYLDPKLLDSDCRIKTDPHLRVPIAGPLTYALGDASTFARPAIHNITSAVPILCNNIRDDLLGVEGQDKEFKEDERETQMVLLGKRRAVGAAMGWWMPGWIVRMIKRDYWLWTTPKLWRGQMWDRSS